MADKQWVYLPKPEKFTKTERDATLDKVNKYAGVFEKLKNKMKRVDMKAGCVYLYHYIEPFINGYGTLIKPLIEGKYLEVPFARITFYDKEALNCSAEYQRHNG